ncbi:MAG: LysM peptidoglycan-binding domain-containing protein [Lachnospiraceae bacterium]|nr:LysM peptidoglycan-binding domain-containing protein [Lachnospiraceae bacterium]
MENENLLPKNIRQIGEIQGRQKICLEDYVMTYIRKMESRGDGNYLGILLGERKSTGNAEYVFVRGIMEAPDASRMRESGVKDFDAKESGVKKSGEKDSGVKESGPLERNEEKKEQERLGLWQAFQKRYGLQENLQEESPESQPEHCLGDDRTDASKSGLKDGMTGQSKNSSENNRKDQSKEDTEEAADKKAEPAAAPADPWEEWKREQQRRFPGWEIQGCCVIGTYPSGQLEELSAHLPEAVRMLYHLQEQEERLYWLVGEQYEGVRGYFVFYEQNSKMQEYLSELFGNGSVEKEGGSDSAIISFREKVKSKAEEKSQSFLRLASSFFVVGVLIVGVVVVNRVSDAQMAQSVSDTAQVSSTAEGQNQSATDSVANVSVETGISVAADAGDAAEVSSATDAGESAEEAVTASAGSNTDAEDFDSGAEITDTEDLEAEEEENTEMSVSAESVSGESVLAGSDAFWADGEEDNDENEDAAVVNGSADDSVSEDSAAASSADGSEASESTTANAAASSADTTEVTDSTVAEETSSAVTETASRQVQAAYVIREGDTLAEICARYYGSLDRMEELCEANGIEDADLIIPGQKIVLP